MCIQISNARIVKIYFIVHKTYHVRKNTQNLSFPCFQLLNRVFDIMREKNPDIVAGEKKRFIMKPPQIMRVGTKKSAFANFADICRM